MESGTWQAAGTGTAGVWYGQELITLDFTSQENTSQELETTISRPRCNKKKTKPKAQKSFLMAEYSSQRMVELIE